MRTLLDEEYAPITDQIGLIRADVETVAEECASWMLELGKYAGRSSHELPSLRHALELVPPLTTELRRSLFVEMKNGWTACFNNLINGSDVSSTCWTVAKRLQTHTVMVRSIPNIKRGDRLRYGAIQFWLHRFEQDDPADPLNHDFSHDRVLDNTNDGGHWVFDATGPVQSFEQTAQYKARPVRKRFTSQMLEDYCNALGIGPFDDRSYLSRCIVVETSIARPEREKVRSLAEARAWLDIEPGDAARYDG